MAQPAIPPWTAAQAPSRRVPAGGAPQANFEDWVPTRRAQLYQHRYNQGYYAPDPDANLPRDAIRIKPAYWYLDPTDNTIGLGRYGRRYGYGGRRRYSRYRRGGRGAYTSQTGLGKAKRKSAKKRKTTRRKRKVTRRRRTGRGGFFSDLWGDIKNVGKTAWDDVLKPGLRDIYQGLKPGITAAAGLTPLGPIGSIAANSLLSKFGDVTGLGRYRKRRFMGRGAYSMADSDPVGAGGDNLLDAIEGDTALAADSALQRTITLKPRQASIINRGDGEFIFRHREYIGDIKGSTNFRIAMAVALNPGLSPEQGGAFPWLSGIAQHFQLWRAEGIQFDFVSSSGTLSTSQALGEVIIATLYNPNDPQPVNKAQMLTTRFAESRVPAADFSHMVECSPETTMNAGKFMVRGGPIEAGATVAQYDLGNVFVATQGQAGEPTLGSIWVTYQISLWNPQTPSTMRQNTSTQSQAHFRSAPIVSPDWNPYVDANWFGADLPFAKKWTNLPVTIGEQGINSISFGSGMLGTYHVTVAYVFLVPAVTPPGWSANLAAMPTGNFVQFTSNAPNNLNIVAINTAQATVGPVPNWEFGAGSGQCVSTDVEGTMTMVAGGGAGDVGRMMAVSSYNGGQQAQFSHYTLYFQFEVDIDTTDLPSGNYVSILANVGASTTMNATDFSLFNVRWIDVFIREVDHNELQIFEGNP